MVQKVKVIQLKRNHHYFYQIQGAMAIAEVEWCDFIVWTPNDMTVERISFSKPILGLMLQ